MARVQQQTIHLSVWHFDSEQILARVELGFDGQTGGCPHTPDQLDDRLVIGQRTAAPILRDVAEESVFDLVPLRGPWLKIRHADGEAGAVGEALQLDFPQPRSGTVAAAGIGRDAQLMRLGVRRASHMAPPPAIDSTANAGVS